MTGATGATGETGSVRCTGAEVHGCGARVRCTGAWVQCGRVLNLPLDDQREVAQIATLGLAIGQFAQKWCGQGSCTAKGMGAKRFQDLVAWQLARELRTNIGVLVKIPALRQDADLGNQLRRAARSATGNIAEGFPCPSHAEFARFLDIAARSLREIEDRLTEAVDANYLTEAEAAPAFNFAKRTSVAVARLTAYLRRTP